MLEGSWDQTFTYQLREKVVGDANGESKEIGLYGKSKQRCKMPDRILHACVTKKALFTPRPKPIKSTESTIGSCCKLANPGPETTSSGRT